MEARSSALGDQAQQRSLPSHRHHVVAGDHSLFRAQSVDETHDVADVMEHRILLHLLRTVASPMCARPGPPLPERPSPAPETGAAGAIALGKAVARDDEQAFTLLGVQADAVRLEHPMRLTSGIVRSTRGSALGQPRAPAVPAALRNTKAAPTVSAPRPEHVASGKTSASSHCVAPGLRRASRAAGVRVTPDLQARCTTLPAVDYSRCRQAYRHTSWSGRARSTKALKRSVLRSTASFRRAAAELGVTSIGDLASQAIRALEARVGAALSSCRTTRSVQTDRGRRAVPFAEACLQEQSQQAGLRVTPNGGRPGCCASRRSRARWCRSCWSG